MPPLSEAERMVPLPALSGELAKRGRNAFAGLAGALGGVSGHTKGRVLGQFFVSLLPALAIASVLTLMYAGATAPVEKASTAGLVEAGGDVAADFEEAGSDTGLAEPPAEAGTGLAEPPAEKVAGRGAGASRRAGAGAGREGRKARQGASGRQDRGARGAAARADLVLGHRWVSAWPSSR